MRKNKMMRLASVILVLTLLSTCAISGTFAKYTTKASATDTARVANWGIVITAGGTLYSDSYAIATATNGANMPITTTAAKPDATSITVNAQTTAQNIVAPGTKSFEKGAYFSIEGEPEVASVITGTIKASDIYLKAGSYAIMSEIKEISEDDFNKLTNSLYTVNDGTYTAAADYDAAATYYLITDATTVANDYYPVKYTLKQGDTPDEIAGFVKVKATDIAGGLVWGLNNMTAVTSSTADGITTWTLAADAGVFPANFDFATEQLGAVAGLDDLYISWEWEFENSDTTTATANNAADTILGQLIAQRNSAIGNSGVVVIKSGDNYVGLTIGADDACVKSDNTEVAYLDTQFTYNITVTQVD